MLKILMVDLFLNPRKFFKEHILVYKKYYIWLIYIIGISDYIERFDLSCAKAELLGGKKLEFSSSLSWPTYWILALIISVLGGIIIWWLYGWWYKVRIQWSGAKQPDPFESRLVFILSSLVYAVPAIVTYFATSFFFKNPWEAYSFDYGNFYVLIIVGLAYMLLYFWSVFVSYIGVTTRFTLVKWKARLWFIILPMLMQGISTTAIVTLFYLFG